MIERGYARAAIGLLVSLLAAARSRNTWQAGCRWRIEAGQRLVTGPSNTSRTASALRSSGTVRITIRLDMMRCTVIEIATAGTSSRVANQPSPNCCLRQRSGETLGAQWREIDLHAATWTVPASRMKTGDAFSVPLSERAVAILADARRVARKEPTADGFVFPGVIPKRPLSNMALAMLMRRMGVDATAHGFRTSFRTWCSDVAHVPFEVAEACLSHRVGSAVSRAYARSDMLERRRPVMDEWAAFLPGEASSGRVVPIGSRPANSGSGREALAVRRG